VPSRIPTPPTFGAVTALATISPPAPVAKFTVNAPARPLVVERRAVMRGRE
jgi:hypothetical protein